MITRRTRIQLVVFVVITLLGVSYVGARYAQLDRLIIDDSYTVVAHFDEAGGIFTTAEVTYRGVPVGEVEKMSLSEDGVDVHLAIEDDFDKIPAETVALVGNRSAVGEQYVELQPKVDEGPFLKEDSEIEQEDTRTPIAVETLLTDISNTFGTIDREALSTTVSELGDAFGGTGEDLQQIIDTGNSFIETANDNFDVTTALIRDSNVVLKGQVASGSALRTFARDLSLFTRTLADSDQDLRTVIDNGSVASTELRTFLEENGVELGDLVNNLITSGEVSVRRLAGIEQVLVLYPYVVEGGFTVVSKSADGKYDAHFGLIITDEVACTQGYESTDRRTPDNRDDRPMNFKAGCTAPATESNARGAQNLNRTPTSYDAPVVAEHDQATGKVTWSEDTPTGLQAPALEVPAPASLGEESWKWLYLQPLLATQE